MKACVLHAIGQLVYEEVATPVPKEGEVLLKIKASGICGSDLDRIFVKGTYSFPLIPGHEFAGEIVDAGKNVPAGLIGKKAAVFPLLPCRVCEMCEAGEYASCRNYDYFGSRCHGGFAQYIAVPVWNLVMGAAKLSFEEMALAEPAAVSLHALNRAGVKLGDTVAIFGAGAIGLMLAAFAGAEGADRVILLDIDEKKLAFAKSLGYTVINNKNAAWPEQLMDITGGRGADIAIEGAGAAAAAEGCFLAAKPLGKVVLMGNPTGDMHLRQKEYWEILRKQLTLFGTWNSSYGQNRNDWRIVLDQMASGRVDLKKLISHRFNLSLYDKAFAVLTDKNEFTSRVMLLN
jgi:L-iditol 2-dehydrogenase